MDWTVHIAIAVLIGFLIVGFVGQRTIVNGESMMPSLKNEDQLIIEKITPKVGTLKYGDIVTIDVKDMEEVRESPIIKRVIGVAGDKVEVKNGKVYLNGKELKENYINGNNTDPDPIYTDNNSVVVPKGKIYVLGDNRMPGMSLDSRRIGPLDISRVGGRAVIRFWPFNSFTTFKRPQQ